MQKVFYTTEILLVFTVVNEENFVFERYRETFLRRRMGEDVLKDVIHENNSKKYQGGRLFDEAEMESCIKTQILKSIGDWNHVIKE